MFCQKPKGASCNENITEAECHLIRQPGRREETIRKPLEPGLIHRQKNILGAKAGTALNISQNMLWNKSAGCLGIHEHKTTICNEHQPVQCSPYNQNFHPCQLAISKGEAKEQGL